MKILKYKLLLLLSIATCCCSAQVGIGTNTPDSSAILHLQSTSKGLLPTRMTIAQKDSIKNPANGLMVYDTDSNDFSFYKSSKWDYLAPYSKVWSIFGTATDHLPDTFIWLGTSDNTPLKFMVNGGRAGIIDHNYMNAYLGYQSGKSSAFTATRNAFLGDSTGYLTSTGHDNSFIGKSAGFGNTSGLYNNYVGAMSGYSASTADHNNTLGYQTLYNNTGGDKNVGIASNSLYNNSTGDCNLGVGHQTLYKNTTGSYNIALGCDALTSNTTGSNNVSIGGSSLGVLTVGDMNVAVGTDAMKNQRTGLENTAVGAGALVNDSTGQYNTAVGKEAMKSNKTGSNNIALGYKADVSFSTLFNATMIGSGASVDSSNSVRIGNSQVKRWGFGVNVGQGKALVVGSDSTNGNGANLSIGGTWTNASSFIKKDRIQLLDGNDILKKVMQLHIDGWYYKGTNEYHIGPYAEEFYHTFNTGTDQHYISTVDPAGIALKAIQELNKKNDDLKMENELLKQRLDRLEQMVNVQGKR